MGGTVSSGESNEELVDNLVSAHYITNPVIERVFRTVDRGHYFPDDVDPSQRSAYRDMAMRQGRVHISAPCIYSEVMQNMDLKPGLSFLNLGSGTGYLSTMAGLLLGVNGTNHGVEIYEEMIDYSRKRLAQFMAKSGALDEFEFCPPQFVQGNALMLPSGAQYDRIYCGAACNEGTQLDYLKNLLKVGGVLISPVGCELIRYKRLSEEEWKSKVLLPVSFAILLPTAAPFLRTPELPHHNALSLEDLSCFAVRAVLRRNVAFEHPELLDCSERRAARERIRAKRKACSSDDSDDGVGGLSTPLVRNRMKFDSGIVEDIDDSDLSELNDDDDSWIWDQESEDLVDALSSESHKSPVEEKQEPVPTFSDYMRDKIKGLMLPKPLRISVNLGRPL